MGTSSNTASSVTASLTQAERTAISDRAMLEAAVALILERGIEKTTLALIGERAGYSRGLATYRFGSKAGLYDAVFKAISRRWLDYLQAGVGARTGLAAMCAALDALYAFGAESPRELRVLKILYCAAAIPQSKYRQTSVSVYQRQLDDVADWVRGGQEDGSIRDDAVPENVASQYIAYTSGMTYLWLINPAAIDFRSANEDMKTQLIRSLGSPGASQ